MDRLANQGQSEVAGAGDLAKNMQDASPSASASPTASSGFGNVPDSGKPGSGDVSDSGSDDSDSSRDAVQFDQQLFKDSPVFIVSDDQRLREFGFNASSTTTLEKVTWQAIVNSNIETLGSSTNFKSSKRAINQFLLVTTNMVSLDFVGDTAKFYNNTMFVQIDWTRDGSKGRTKTELFTVTNSTDESAIKQLTENLKKEQRGQGPAEVTSPPSDASSTYGITKATGTIEPSDNDSSSSSGGGGLSTGATAGIAVGAVIGGLLLIGALVWFLLRRRRRNKQPSEEYTIQQTYAVDKEISGRASDSPNSPYSDENHMQPIALGNVDRDRGAAPTPPPGRSSVASHDRGTNSGVQTPQGMSSNVAHLVEDGMTADEIRRLEEEERQLDDEIERAGRR